MKPIQHHKDPRITNISFDNFTGSLHIINSETNDENSNQSMLTSPRSNGVDHFVPSHQLSLITQPVLGARSRSRKKTTNIIVENALTNKDKSDPMANSRRSSYNDSPPLILPINRVDTTQYLKKTNSNIQHESSDSGLDLSFSTNSSVQLPQYPQQHIIIHRPLSALNEDSSPDDGYHDEHQQQQQQQIPLNGVRLRFPPVHFGRNRSMEDIISNQKREQHHRSGSFTDEQQQQKLSVRDEKKMKRSSDGALLDLLDTSSDSYRRSNTIKTELLYPSTTQHRSLNDLTNKTSTKALSIRNESNLSTDIHNVSSIQTMNRKSNISTLKPLRKKTKLNIIIEPAVSVTSSRLANHDEQINTITRTTSSSSNQTTPRSTHPLSQHEQQMKSKPPTQLGHYLNPEQLRAHVNRSVIERQHPPVPSRRSVMQQLIPFDASPSKVNNLLLRHHVQQHQPTTISHPNSTIQLSPTRQFKQYSRSIYNDETISTLEEEKRKRKEQIKIENFKEQVEKQRLKQKEEFQNKKSSNLNHQKVQKRLKDFHEKTSQEHHDQTNVQHYFIKSTHKQQEKELSFEKNQKKNYDERQTNDHMLINPPSQQQYEQNDHRHRRSLINDSNRILIKERHGSGQSNNTINTTQDIKNNYRRQQRYAHYVIDSLPTNRSDGLDKKQKHYESKPTEVVLRNKTHNHITEKKSSRNSELYHQYNVNPSHGTQKTTLVYLQSRPSKSHVQPFDTSTSRNPILLTQIDSNQHQNLKHENDYQTWQKSPVESIPKSIRMQPISSTNTNVPNLRREREISQLSNISKTDSLQLKEKMIKKYSIGSFPSRSPTSSSPESEHQQSSQRTNKMNTYQLQTSSSPSSQDELMDNNFNTPPRTYRLPINNQQEPTDGRYVIPSDNDQSCSGADHPYLYTLTPDSESNNNPIVQNFAPSKQKSLVSDVYTLPDRDSARKTIERENSSSPPAHHSSKKKYYSPPPPPAPSKITITTEKDEILSIHESDDGWSDDSAELLYVDERYINEKRKITSASHLPLQQTNLYQIQQQNVLL